jgi:1-acyl-sn-glycerol-3-phosphate acyltransferase
MHGPPMALARTLAIVRRQTRLLRLAVWTSYILSGASALNAIFGGPERRDLEWKRKWVRGATGIVGLDLRVTHGAGSWEHPKARLVVSNHRTPLDVVVLLSLFGGHFLANHRVSRAPIVGPGAHRIGTVFVDREDRKSGVAAIRTMRRLLEAQKTLIVFPEGTTFGGDEVRPFKGGAFTAANGLGDVDVVPVGIAYTPGHEFAGGKTGDHVRSFLGRPSTPAWVSVGEPMPLPAERKGMEDRIRASVQELVERSRRAAQEDLAGEVVALPAGTPEKRSPHPEPLPRAGEGEETT